MPTPKNSPEILAFIPARFGSRRFPGKPLALIGGKSLIQRTYENSKTFLEKIVVCTDDQRIYDHVIGFGGAATLTSPSCSSGTERIADALEKNPADQDPSIIVNIQGDEPCIEADVVKKVILALENDPETVMSTAVTPSRCEEERANPSVVKCVLDQRQRALYFSRSAIPFSSGQFYKHLGIYAYRTQFLRKLPQLPPTPLQQAEDLEQLKALEHGYSIAAAIVQSASIGVDTPEDLKKVEKQLCQPSLSS